MTTFPGGYLHTTAGSLDLAIQTPGPIVLHFSGEHLAALTAACLRAFREGDGRLFKDRAPSICNARTDAKREHRRRRDRGLIELANGWRLAAPANDSEFARGLEAGRVACAMQLERVLGK